MHVARSTWPSALSTARLCQPKRGHCRRERGKGSKIMAIPGLPIAIHVRTYAVGRKGTPHMASDRPKHPIYGGGNDPVRPQLRNSYRTYAVGRKGTPHMASDRPKHPIYGGGNDPVRPQLRNSYPITYRVLRRMNPSLLSPRLFCGG
jgi:hypothetical protein